MPSIHRVGGLRIAIFPNDHSPPHVHVFAAGWEVRIALGNCEELKPRLSSVVAGRPKAKDLRSALLAVDTHCSRL